MNIADIGIYYWKKSTSMTVKFIKKQKSFIEVFQNLFMTIKS